MKKKIFLKYIISIFIGLIAFGFLFLFNSLPILKGNLHFPGLNSKVIIERDNLSIPSIKSENRLDLFQSIGFLHAQERFFQMDNLRRYAAGELSEIFGKSTLEIDIKQRTHGFRKFAEQAFTKLTDDEKTMLIAYAKGVNYGLKSLKTKPFEYGLLFVKPKEWSPVDSILVCLALYDNLQKSSVSSCLSRKYVKEVFPPKIYDFFINNGTSWDATLDGSTKPWIDIPSKSDFMALNKNIEDTQIQLSGGEEPPIPAMSNCWVIKNGENKPILACDMHLSLSVPNMWYRASFYSMEEDIEIHGITLPGMPNIIIGSNGNIAWGLTNASIDTTQIKVLKLKEDDHNLYLTSSGWLPITKNQEKIKVKGAKPYILDINSTIWGPVLKEKFFNETIVRSWVAYDSDCINFKIMDFEKAQSVDEALVIAKKVMMPVMNLIVADKEGDIAWTLMGPVLNRDTADSPLKYIDSKDYPVVKNPSNAFLWSANNRSLGAPYDKFYEGFGKGIRARLIKDNLSKKFEKIDEAEMFKMQFDTKTPVLNRWADLLLKVIDENDITEEKAIIRKEILAWDGTCNKDARGLYWIKTFRGLTIQTVMKRLTGSFYKTCRNSNFDFEEAIWLIINKQPAYLKNPKFLSWDLELSSIVQNIIKLRKEFPVNKHWGDFNKLKVKHPLSSALPFLSRVLDMPEVEMDGDSTAINVVFSSFGSTERMVISPGNEKEGILHMPCGQSAHPLSSHYRDGHKFWLQGESYPLLPKKTEKVLILVPGK